MGVRVRISAASTNFASVGQRLVGCLPSSNMQVRFPPHAPSFGVLDYMSDLELSLFVSGTLARIQSILDVLACGAELEGDDLANAIRLTLSEDSTQSRQMNLYHRELITPILNDVGELTLVGGDAQERHKLVQYFVEIRRVLLNVRPQRM